MDFRFDAEQEELRAAARAFLAERAGPAELRAAAESEDGVDPELWKQLTSELGWTALLVPESCGGLGLGFVELVALLEVMGEALLCAPYFSTVCLAENALLVAGSDAQQREWLPGLADGSRLATLAHLEPSGRRGPDGVETLALPDGDGYRLRGRKRYVLDGHRADWIVVPARRESSAGTEGLSLFVVPGDAPGLARAALPTVDRTRRQADLALDDVRVPAAARLGPEGAAGPLLEKILDRAQVALAAEQVGGAQACLDRAVAYASERVQFGRPIGSFQAIKHKCADLLVRLETARSAAYYGACVAAEDSDELPLVASLALASASEAFFACAADCLQIHGGVGFTWEYDVHLYLKRAKAGQALLGDPAWQRERIARGIGL